MTSRRVEPLLWATAAVFLALGVLRWRFAVDASDLGVSPTQLVARAIPDPLGAAADRTAALAIDADPFRASRRPSSVAFAAQGDGAPVAPRAPRPPLAMAGSVGGPPWSAILDGVPGHDGSLIVTAGDTVAGLRIKSVRRDSVVVQGADTTWRLGVRKSWQ
jgi:hypothetical protein